jgi:hypothetical protein
MMFIFCRPTKNRRDTVSPVGSTRILDPAMAQNRLAAAREAAARNPEDPKLAQAVAIAESLSGKFRYYEEARRPAQIITRVSQTNDHR